MNLQYKFQNQTKNHMSKFLIEYQLHLLLSKIEKKNQNKLQRRKYFHFERNKNYTNLQYKFPIQTKNHMNSYEIECQHRY